MKRQANRSRRSASTLPDDDAPSNVVVLATRRMLPMSLADVLASREDFRAQYPFLVAQIRALRSVPGYGSDVSLMRLLEPVVETLIWRARPLARSDEQFESDIASG